MLVVLTSIPSVLPCRCASRWSGGDELREGDVFPKRHSAMSGYGSCWWKVMGERRDASLKPKTITSYPAVHGGGAADGVSSVNPGKTSLLAGRSAPRRRWLMPDGDADPLLFIMAV